MEFDPLYQPPLLYFSWYHVTTSIFRIANYLAGKIHSILLGYIGFPTNFSDFQTILTNWLFLGPESRFQKLQGIFMIYKSGKNNPKLTSFFFAKFFQSLENTQKGRNWRLLQRLANLKGHWRGFALRATFAPYAMRYYLDDRERCGGYTEVVSWLNKIQKVQRRWILKPKIKIFLIFWKISNFGKTPQEALEEEQMNY